MKNLCPCPGKSSAYLLPSLHKLMIAAILLISASRSLTAADYYWVGGSGDWSDINHWVTTSGGTVNYTLVPTANDNVFFDENSFTAAGQTVVINAGNYVCRDMDWTEALFHPTLSSAPGNELRIYGSLLLTSDMNYDLRGELLFEATSAGHRIDMAGHQTKNAVSFNGAAGSWTLLSSLDAQGFTIYFRAGNLNTQGYDIHCGTFSSDFTTHRSLDLQSSEITADASWIMNAQQLSLMPGQSRIILTSATAAFLNKGGLITYNHVVFSDTNGLVSMINQPGTWTRFNSVTFLCNAKIYGNYELNRLYLYNKDYEFRGNDTLTIHQNLITTGNCSASVYIRTDCDSIKAYIRKPSGSLVVSRLIMQDIAGVGPATYHALQSVDLGNNPGWNIQSPQALTLYWVGGSGRWDDPSHWSFTSGGPGGACVPNPLDNVRFDHLSFNGSGQTVYLNTFNAFCNDMDWSGAAHHPAFSGTFPSSLNIFGSLHYIQNMQYQFNGYTYFRARDTGNTITTEGTVFRNTVLFKGDWGHWKLLDAFNAGTSNIFLIKGFLHSNDQQITASNFISAYLYFRGLDLGSSTINLSGTFPTTWHVCNYHLDFDAGTSVINFTGSYGGMTNVSGDTMQFHHVNFLNTNGMSVLSSSDIVSRFVKLTYDNNGSIKGCNVFDTLLVNNSFYRLNEGDTQTIVSHFAGSGSCNMLTYIFSSLQGSPSFIRCQQTPIQAWHLILEDIHALSPAPMTAFNSTDLGNNQGWSFTSPAPRHLYWVNGHGNWNDPQHWSLSSGGPGGECIPTPVDMVHFDMNSFDTLAGKVTTDGFYSFCHDMLWESGNLTPRFAGAGSCNLMVYGSFLLDSLLNWQFDGNLYFRAGDTANLVRTEGRIIRGNTFFDGANGQWLLEGGYTSISNISVLQGELQSRGYDITGLTFRSNSALPRSIRLGSSKIYISAGDYTAWVLSSQQLQFDAGSSEIIFHSPNGGMYNIGGDSIHYYDVSFTNSGGCSELISSGTPCSFNHAFFRSDGNIFGNHIYDTLTFFPSGTYTLESGKTQVILEKLNMSGNGCFPISLRSSNTGSPSFIFKSAGVVSAAFVEMRDQYATGGAVFYTGDYSVDLSGNNGWIFGSGPGYVFGLPDTITACPGDTVNISTANFIGGISFVWQDGTNSSNYPAIQEGLYTVEITYADLCYLTDTLVLMHLPLPFVNAGNDTLICPGSPVSLFADAMPGAAISWSNGATTAGITVQPSQPTTFFVSASNACGLAADSVGVMTFSNLSLTAGADTGLCPGDSILLTAISSPGATLIWSTGDTSLSVMVSPFTTSTFGVTAIDPNGCGLAYDSVIVDVFSLPWASAGADTGICESLSVTLHANGPAGASFVWSNGSTDADNMVNQPYAGWYTVSVTDVHQCGTASDSLYLSIIAMPSVDAGEDISACSGSTVLLQAQALSYDHLLWSNGDTGLTCNISASGEQSMIISAMNQCGQATDTILISSLPLPQPVFRSGPEHCERSDGMIEFFGAYSYVWEDGFSGSLRDQLEAGIYSVTVSDGQCEQHLEVRVDSIRGPKADFTVNETFLFTGQDDFIFTDASEGAVNWHWDFGDDSRASGEPMVSHRYRETGTYTIHLIAEDQFACYDTADLQVTLEFPELFFIANAFSPNGDGLNEVFGPSWRNEGLVSDYHFAVYNRWGELVYTTDDLYGCWDGKSGKSGGIAQDGVYTWIIQMSILDGPASEHTGQVSLLK